MFGALASGLLLFAFGWFIVDHVVETRTSERWARVTRVGDVALANATRDVLSRLWGIHSGPDLDGEMKAIKRGLTPARELKEDLPDKSAIAAFKNAPRWDRPTQVVLPRKRMEHLLADPDWLAWASTHLHDLYAETGRLAQDWAARTAGAPSPPELLNHFSAFSDQLTALAGALNVLRYNLGDPARETVNRERVLAYWELADVKGRVLLNALWAAAGWDYEMALPEYARDAKTATAFKSSTTIGSKDFVVPEPAYAP